MTDPLERSAEYDDRYLAGVLFFNRGDYFEAHEVWEHLWQECDAADRRFFQGLIQAAVSIYHAIRGNRAGASRLSASARRYLELYPPHYRGFARQPFTEALGAWLTPFLDEGAVPTINTGILRIDLNPTPTQWPEPEAVLHATEERADS